jgi:uncharacterized alpha-E superfamily protein
MLSRVADNLFWMSRYLERAEHTARVLSVSLDLRLERSPKTIQRSWERLFASLQIEPPEGMNLTPYNITQTLTFDATNLSSIAACVAAARENARQVREQISSEMWEQINRLSLEVKKNNINKMWRGQPHEFFQAVKEGAHLFQGISDSTMSHGEGWHFIQVGQLTERISNVAALLDVYLGEAAPETREQPTPEDYLDWITLLRSCTAFEAYCKIYTADLKFNHIAEFLLLNEQFPHSIHFAVRILERALNSIADATDTRKNTRVYRLPGRLRSTLNYDQIDEVVSNNLHRYLENILALCSQIHAAIYQTYIEYPIEDKLTVANQ